MTQLLRVLNVGVLSAIYLALVLRQGAFSTGYRAALVAVAIVLGLAVLSLFGPNPFADAVGQRRLARPRVRTLAAVLPWMALLAVIMSTGTWWIQQVWTLRLFATYALALWSIVWFTAPTSAPGVMTDSRDGSAAADRPVRILLIGFACLLGVLAVNGLAFGASSFGVGVSALVGSIAAAMAGVAKFSGRARCDSLLTATFGIVMGLACVEVGVRMLHLGESLLEVDNPEYVRQFHHITPPNSAFLSPPKPLDEFSSVLVEINSLGIRGPEIAPGPVDLLLIGDSMIEARQLPWDQTVAALLPEAFRARSTQVRAVSHGVRGWAPLLEWNWYLKVGRRFKPKTVLLFFFWNDLWVAGDEVRTFQAVMRPDGRPDYFDVPVEPDWVWYKRIRTVRLAESMVQRVGLTAVKRTLSLIGGQGPGLDLAGAEATARRMAGDGLLASAEVDLVLTKPLEDLSPRLQRVAQSEFWPSTRPFALWTETQRQAAAKTENELRLFAEDVAADGGRLVIVHVPNAYQIAPTECSVARYLVGLDGDRMLPTDSGIQTWLHGVADRHRIGLLDPSEAMRAYHQSQPSPATPLFLRADCHWSARGHQLVAEYLADWYLRSRLPQ